MEIWNLQLNKLLIGFLLLVLILFCYSSCYSFHFQLLFLLFCSPLQARPRTPTGKWHTDETFPVVSAPPCAFVCAPANMQLGIYLDLSLKHKGGLFYLKLSRQFNTSLRGPNNCWDKTIFALWISPLFKVTKSPVVLLFFFFPPTKLGRVLRLLSHYQTKQVSTETGRLVVTVIVKLLTPLICLPLWCLALSQPITRRRGLSRSLSSNLMKDSQLLLLLSARLQLSRNNRNSPRVTSCLSSGHFT